MAFLIMVSQSDYAAWSKAKANSKGEWTTVTESAVEGSQLPDSNPSDVAEFCAGYGNLRREDRVKFWVALTSKVAESKVTSNHMIVLQNRFWTDRGIQS